MLAAGWTRVLAAGALAALAGCGSAIDVEPEPGTPGRGIEVNDVRLPGTPAGGGGDCENSETGMTPIDELGTGAYEGEQGGLYPGGRNELPARHLRDGLELARAIRPLGPDGRPDPGGEYALLSIGVSITASEFGRFKRIADADPRKDPALVIVNGAQDSITADLWADPAHPAWEAVDGRLADAGVTPRQVAVAWIKVVDAPPPDEFPAAAERLRDETKAILGLLHERFPSLRIAYLTSRSYGGYATTRLNPEPYAYETAFAAKWTIEDQIEGDPALNWDPGAGAVRAPWIAWGPYWWADGIAAAEEGGGERSRSAGASGPLVWRCGDFVADGTHPSGTGMNQAATELLRFVETDETARLWFSAARG